MSQKTIYEVPGVDTSLVSISQASDDEPEKSIARAEAGAGTDWMRDALNRVEEVARRQETLTADDIWSEIKSPMEPKAMGAVMRRAVTLGIICGTDQYRKSDCKECHHRKKAVWKSLLFRG
jgi:glucuronate isomerase